MSEASQDGRISGEQLSAERRAIVLREDSDWAKYGIDDAERASWIEAGIPADHAPLAAVARHVGDDGQQVLTPAWLDLDVGGVTPLQMLLRGDNSADVERAMERTFGRRMNNEGSSWMGLVAPTPNQHQLKIADARRLQGTNTHPSRVVEVRDRMARWLHGDLPRLFATMMLQDAATLILERGEDALETEVEGDGVTLFRVVAASHGVVMEDPEAVERMAAAIPLDPSIPPVFETATTVFGAQPDRYYFHASPDEHRALIASARKQNLPGVFSPASLPAAAGFGWLAGDDITPARMLGWGPWFGNMFAAGIYDAEPAIQSAMQSTYLTPDGVKSFVDNNRDNPDDLVTPRHSDEADVIMLLMALVDEMESRGVADPTTEPLEATKNARRRDSRAAKQDKASQVALVYARSSGLSSSEDHDRRERDHRWPVRGHYRDQWYPSLQQHKRIWIDEQVRGPEGAPLRTRTQVHVMKPNTDESS